jgi:hypothetical protein
MKRSLAIVMLALMAIPAWGQTARKKAPAKAAPPPAVTAEDVRALRDALAAQQQQINQLREELRHRDDAFRSAQQKLEQATTSASEAQVKAAAAQTASDEQKDSYAKLASDVKDMQGNMTTAALQSQEDQKRVASVEGLVGRFRFNGDVRIRQEDFFGSGAGACASSVTNCNPRVRERIRARLGVDGRLGEDFTGGFYLASGVLTDPTSTNETLTNVFEKKTVGIDRAFITYNPSAAKWLTLTGGKFAATWIKTNQTFDPDLNPEGFSEKLSWDVKGSSLLKNVTWVGIQLLYNEANRPAAAASCVVGQTNACLSAATVTGGDSYAAGGQLSAKLQVMKRWSLTPSYMILNWHNQDVILNEPNSVTGGTSATNSASFASNGMTNAFLTLTNGTTTVRKFYSQFLYSDVILDNNISTGLKKLPNWRILLEYLDNLNAQDHPLLANGSVATNLGRQSHLYRVETSLGQQRNRGDWQFTYSFHRQEQDSVIATFDESDQRAPTNIVQHTFVVAYRVRNNTSLSYTQWIGRTLNSNLQNAVLGPGFTPGTKEDYLKRMQFDVVYTF